MTDHIRGVNLGGWLVVEKWLTPKLFTGTSAVDEYTLTRHPDGKRQVDNHRKAFITERDFEWLCEHDITFVRIPVGYWLFESIDDYESSVKYLDQAMQWAEKHNIRVLICLHGARGSQNGFDNSGRAGRVEWFTNKTYQEETIVTLEQIAKRYHGSSALWGIELLNEPTPRGHYFALLKFHRAADRRLRQILRPETRIIYHDAFQPLLFAGTFWRRGKCPIMMDIHWYGFPIKTNDFDEYLRRSARIRRIVLRIAQLWQPVIIGEWSTVLPQRFFDQVPKDQHMELLARNAEMQQTVYRKAAGWMYWNYKAEGDGMWNFRDLIERGVIDPKLGD